MTNARSPTEIEEELSVQLRLLKKACHAFDEGDFDESRNISRALRVLCADDKAIKNECLIKLSNRDQTQFLDSSFRYHRKNTGPEFQLIAAILGPDTVGPRATLDELRSTHFLPFSDWLEQTILDDKEGNSFNRLRLIKALANSDGGTHYPKELRNFVRKLKDVTFSAFLGHSEKEIPMKGAAEQSLRQIGHEVIRSLDPEYRREIHVENGAIFAVGLEGILYPGRKLKFRGTIKNIQNSRPPKGASLPFQGIAPPKGRLPYESTGRNESCPCGSELKFKNCCLTARDFDAEFIKEFERRHSLP